MIIEKGRQSFLVKCDSIDEEYWTSEVVSERLTSPEGAVYAFEVKRTDRHRERYKVYMHINYLDEFYEKIRRCGVSLDKITTVDLPEPESQIVNFKVKDIWSTREHQIPAVDSLSDLSHPIGLLLMGTGRGKTYCLLRSVANIGRKFLMLVRPKYMDKWVEDIQKTYDINDDSIVYVQGSKDFNGLLADIDGCSSESDCIVMSNATYKAYLKRCNDPTKGSDVMPEDLMAHLGVGVVCFDEADEHYHAGLMLLLNSNVQKALAVTATIRPKDNFMKRIFAMSFSRQQTYKENRSSRHITMIPISFSFRNPARIKTKGWKSMYSHASLEKSVMADGGMLARYTKMIIAAVDDWHKRKPNPDSKLIIYAYTKMLCTHLTKKIDNEYPQLSVKRYVAGDPYENIIEPNIRVTTISSGGRAMDIPNLSGVLLTVNVDSESANDQLSGRLRESEDGSIKLFYYIFSKQIPAHVKYHRNRARTLASKLKSSNEITYPSGI